MPAAGDASAARVVEEIDARVATDDVLARFYALELACHDELSPGEPIRSRHEAIAFYRYLNESLGFRATVGLSSAVLKLAQSKLYSIG